MHRQRLALRVGAMRVLIVEDEERMADLLKRALEEEGHAVDVARDGPDGVWLATENPYGAIVLDVMLPGFDGFEVCRRLRAAEVWVPVLMLTAATKWATVCADLIRAPMTIS